MMLDYEGNLWFASSRQGVMKIVDNRFTDISKLAGMSNQVVNTTCLYQEDLYIGTDNGLFVLDSDNNVKTNVLTDLLDGIRIRSIKGDAEGNLWLCSYSEIGLVCYHGDGTYTTYNEDNGLKSNRVRTLEPLSDGTIAVATSGGLNLIKNGNITATYDEKDGISNTEILTVCEGENGRIYLGSDGGGIYVIEDNQVSHLGLDDGLESEIILRIKKDPQRNVYWLITSNSIAYMKDDVITTLSGFPYSNNFDLYFNSQGGIWILSSNGIYVVNGDQLLADEELEYSFYDMKSGLPCITTANSRSCVDAEGNLYIAGSTGVFSVNIEENRSEDEQIRLVVPYIEADDQIINLKEGETVTIPAHCKRLTIYAYAITYSLQNSRLNYYLEGFDESSISVSRQEMQPVRYTNLGGGKYTFHLSVIDTMTGAEENSISVTLIKEKALYERTWFLVLLVVVLLLILAGGIVFYTRIKTAKLLKKQEENKIYIHQMIQAFAKTIDFKDKYTTGHSFRVAKYAELIARKMGYSEKDAENVRDIGLLHDVGKITIPDEILNKPGKLSDEEYEIIKQHSANGYDILKEIEIMPELALGAGYHHERMDGKGYPSGKKAEDIPQIAQIIAVADTFDAMNSTRPYRKQMAMEDIVEELKRVSGTQLNGEIVQALLALIEEGIFDASY
jgi:energy-coupling factor transport system substrate-specific component